MNICIHYHKVYGLFYIYIYKTTCELIRLVFVSKVKGKT